MNVQISVITPAYNTADLILETIESVACQKGVTFEHIIIDDCSTDDTRAVIESARKRYPHIRVKLLEQNLGQSQARNFGIEMAEGQYIAFLDSDDLYDSDDALAAWYHNARSNDADMVGAQYWRFDDTATNTSLRKAKNSLNNIRLNDVSIETFPELVNFTSCWLFLYRKAFLDEAGIRFSTLLRQREDRVFFTQALVAARRVNVIPNHLIRYRLREGSTMRTPDAFQLTLFATHLQIVNETMRAIADDPRKQAFLRANMHYYIINIDRYWRSVLLRDGFENFPELGVFLEKAAGLDWFEGSLKADEVLDNIAEEKQASGYLDVLRILMMSGLKAAFLEFLAYQSLSIANLAGLHAWLGSRRGDPAEAAKARSRKAMVDDYFRNVQISAGPGRRSRAARVDLPPIVLHAGMTKTGSSALQKFFEINRFRLLEEYGVYYPFTGLEIGKAERSHRTSGHAGLIGNMLNDDHRGFQNLCQEIASLPQKPKTVFLSAENILSARFWRGGAAPRLLAKGLTGHDVTVVCYLRRQDEWLESMYVESITSPGLRYTAGIEDFVAEQKAEGLLNFTSVASAWQAAFPSEKLVFRSYEHAIKTSGDTIRDFLSVIGMAGCDPDIYDRPSEKEQNLSTSKLAACLIRDANHIPMPRETVLKQNARLAELAEPFQAREAGTGFLDTAARSEIMRVLEVDNRAFYGTFLPDAAWVPLQPARDIREISAHLDVPPRLFSAAQAILRQTPADQPRGEARQNGAHAVKAADTQPADSATASAEAALAYARSPYMMVTSLLSRARYLRRDAIRVIAASGLFDGGFYIRNLPEAASHAGGAIVHYVDKGAKAALDPSPSFSTRGYLRDNPDVASAGINPLYHYVKWGKMEGRNLLSAALSKKRRKPGR